MATATFSFAYKNSDFKRDYKIPVADSVPANDVNDLVRNTAKAINASLAAGTSGENVQIKVWADESENYKAAEPIILTVKAYNT